MFKKIETEKQDVKNLFLRTISNLKPHVWENLPISEYEHLTRSYPHLKRGNLNDGAKNGTDWLSPKLYSLIEKDNVSVEQLLLIFPNADEKSIEYDFTDFKQLMLIWADKYHLRKEWIFECVCYGMEGHLMRLQEGNESKMIVGGIVYLSTVLPVKIGVNDSWNPLQESFSAYEARVKRTLREQRKNFAGKIEGHKLKTKPVDLPEKIKWLVLWNIEKWTAADIVVNDLNIKPGQTSTANNAYQQNLQYVYDEIQRLAKTFDLPIRTRKLT